MQGVRSKASISHGAEWEERKEGPAQHPLGKGMATHSSILACEIPWAEEPGIYRPWGRKELDTTEVT